MTETMTHALHLERTFQARAHEVFDAFTNPEVMRRWWHAGADWETPQAEVDLREGGAVRVVMRRPDGKELGAGGVYTVVERPSRLAFSWTWDHEPGRRTLIEIEFIERDGRTTVRFDHSALADEASVRSHRQGWNHILDNLSPLLQTADRTDTPYTVKRLTDLDDAAPAAGVADAQEIRFATADLHAARTGLTHHRFRPHRRQPIGHRHDQAEEIYVVLAGSGRIRLDDDVVEVTPLDAIRVAPGVMRAFEAGPDGLEVLAVGARHDGDGEVVVGWWGD